MADQLEHHFSHQAQDESTLAEMGYKQELNRDWSLLHNFGISFSIIVGISQIFRGLPEVSYCARVAFYFSKVTEYRAQSRSEIHVCCFLNPYVGFDGMNRGPLFKIRYIP
ncbi:hypothetical protein MMC26_002562 [Xylographa opegraphella]|nr:hypothetical protein [Xylographa opegraphella]